MPKRTLNYIKSGEKNTLKGIRPIEWLRMDFGKISTNICKGVELSALIIPKLSLPYCIRKNMINGKSHISDQLKAKRKEKNVILFIYSSNRKIYKC